jgi:murein L,D-transpeptidase YcbB/YkuD
LNRRQSLGLAAWAMLGAGCEARAPETRSGAALTTAAPPAAAPAQVLVPPDFAGLTDPAALRFYQHRDWKAAWNPDQAAALTRSLGEARHHALDHATFAPKTPPGAESVRQDIGLTLTALRWAKALSSGYVEPRSIERVFTLQRNEVDLAAGLGQALATEGLGDWFASLPPADAEYKALSAAYAGSACQAGPTPAPDQSAPRQSAPPEKTLPEKTPPEKTRPEDTPPASASPETAPGQSPPSDNASVEAAPKENPPNDSGSKASTLLESPPAQAAPQRVLAAPADRSHQLAANLERRRWLARKPPATRVDVNTASCFLAYLRPDTDPWAARVVVGKPGHETPSIQGSFRRVIANPQWRVPMDIARKEIFPKGGGYLRRQHMQVVRGQVVQQAGPHNSLGLVKFDVEDPYQIYLHDTPAKSLFALPERHKSHGCVRVQNAVAFARKLADERGKAAAFDKALARGKTGEVDIGEEIPVRLLYHTAYADEAGHVTLVPDAYGWNEKLAAALGFPAPPPPAPGDQPDVDLGP